MYEKAKEEIEELLADESQKSIWFCQAGMILRRFAGTDVYANYIMAYKNHPTRHIYSFEKGYVERTRALVRECLKNAIDGLK